MVQKTETLECCEFHPDTRCGPAQCPDCGVLGKPVKKITLGSLLKPEKRPEIPSQDEFCFCRNAACDVVYFIPNKTLFRKEDLTVRIFQKEAEDPAVPVCYCFGWTKEKIRTAIRKDGKDAVTNQIKAEVKRGNCYCEITNPQGSCCLGNVTLVSKEDLTQK